MDQNTVISIVVPIQQEQSLIEDTVIGIDTIIGAKYKFFEIILVDDGSTDGTNQVVTSMLDKIKRIRYLRLSRPFGRDVAISAGIESAIGDMVITLDLRTDPIEILPEMIEACRRSGGIVHGMATNPANRSLVRNWAGSFFRSYCRRHIGVKIERGVSDLRVMSRQAVNALLQVRDQNRYLRVLTLTLGYQHDFHSYTMKAAKGHPRTTRWHQELAIAIDLLAANTRHPLRVVTMAGLTGAIFNLLYGCYVLCIFLIKPVVAEGWTTLSLQLSGMFFFVCVILAVLSEYVGTVLGEVRTRPLYFISQELNSSVLLEHTVRSSIVETSVELKS